MKKVDLWGGAYHIYIYIYMPRRSELEAALGRLAAWAERMEGVREAMRRGKIWRSTLGTWWFHGKNPRKLVV